jgi:hypothetical protein
MPSAKSVWIAPGATTLAVIPRGPIVRIALSRPYTFIVLALLILILSPVMILRTPTDIFPNINIPVIAVGWQYTGMNPEELEGRLTSGFERVLTTTVDNIEHIESTTVNGLDTANAQVTAISQTALRQSPPRRRHLSVMLISRTTRARPLFSPTASRLRRRLACY